MGACANKNDPEQPKRQYQYVIPTYKPDPPRQIQCRVQNCVQKHLTHFCKVCRNADSDHFSRQCSQTIKTKEKDLDAERVKKLDESSKLLAKCRIRLCDEKHPRHYCRICENADSDHFARQCPEGVIAYHGTTDVAYQSISSTQFKISPNGTKGPGVYFAEEQNDAEKIGVHRAQSGKAVVIKAMIPKASVNDKNVTFGPHPHWKSNGKEVTDGEFNQFCVPNPKNIRILEKINV